MIERQKYGRLTPIAFVGMKDRRTQWLCLCDCGKLKVMLKGNVTRGKSLSCGCLVREITKTIGERNKRHGRTHDYLYYAWRSMLKRCESKTDHGYLNYGARGITVCERWKVFENFASDMGERPTLNHSLDRINNDAGYSPENCRWADKITQSNNKRTTRRFEFNGKKRTLREICDFVGMSYGKVYQRMGTGGWPLERAVSTP